MKLFFLSIALSFGLTAPIFALENLKTSEQSNSTDKLKVYKAIIFQGFAVDFHPETTITFFNESESPISEDFEYNGSNKFELQDRIVFEDKFDFSQLHKIENLDLKIRFAEIIATIGLVGVVRGLQLMAKGESLPNYVDIKNPLAQALMLGLANMGAEFLNNSKT